MKRIIVALILAVVSSTALFAQMSDDQIVDYIKEQAETGKDKTQIAKELILQGVSQDQLLRLQKRFQQSKEPSTTSLADNVNRSRVANGEVVADVINNMPFVEEPGKKIFGHDIFRSNNLTFEPNMNIATPSAYVLGPGDEVILDIYGASQYSGSFKIAPDGSITIPNEGPVNVAGLTVTQAQSKVSRTIGGHYQGSNIKLSVGQTRTIIVNVLGEVVTPGTYTLSAFSSVFNALYLAGGITEIGTLRNIKLSRNGKIISTIDVYEYITNGKLVGNVMLQDNDVILVGPYESLVEMKGKVKRPMFYEMKQNESLKTAISLAGGFVGNAYKKKIRVERVSDEGLSIHTVNEWDFANFALEDGDVVMPDTALTRLRNTVKISGAVFYPGSYQLNKDANTVKSLVEQAGNLQEYAVRNRAVLRRVKADRTLEAISVDLEGILSGRTPDMSLQNEDELIIGSNESKVNAFYLTIEGDVLRPGRYAYSENATVEDLIMEAGGLRETASIKNVEIARRVIEAEDGSDGNQLAKVFTIDLDKNLDLSKGSGFKLEAYDYVIIHRNPDYHVQKRVSVSGEIKYAGSYILSNKEERLSDVIKRAGGLTDKAYVNGVQLTRQYTKKDIELQYHKLEIAKDAADSLAIMDQMKNKSYVIGVDLKMVLENPGSMHDVVLAEGDSVYVPGINNVVKISGEVLYPNTVAFAKGKSARYYLNQAGGVSQNGKKNQAYIVYADGQVNTLKDGKVEPGCEIVVPTKIDKKVDTASVSMWSTLASTVATVGAVISTILK